jgi:hypothetical protein
VTPIDKNSEPIDAILRGAMRAEPGPETPECADAESLAAYSERSLAAAHRERLEAHFADCMRCQMLLAEIARADESARGAQAANAVPWYRRWRIAIPAIAAVAAVLVFVAIRRPANEEQRSAQLVAMARKEAPAMQLTERAVVPEAPAPVTAAAAPASAAAAAAPASGMVAMNEAKTEAAPRAEMMSGGTVLHHMAEAAPAPGARAMTAQAGAAPMAAARAYGGAAVGESAAGTEVLITGSVTWIVGQNGMVQRRDPDGTIHILHSGVSTDLVAASAPSATVCWIVGRSGTIIRTTDGEHWEHIRGPSTDNLTRVSASSAKYASITTAGGRSFMTLDGGASWHPQ